LGVWYHSIREKIFYEITVQWNSEELLNAIVEAFERINAFGKDQKRIETALKELGKIKSEASKKKDADKNIKRILKAVKELRKVKSVDISEIRLRLDELLKIWQAKWTMLPGKVELEEDDEHERKDKHKEDEEDEEDEDHSYLKQKEPVLVAAVGPLTGVLGVQKVERLYFYHTDQVGKSVLMNKILSERESFIVDIAHLMRMSPL